MKNVEADVIRLTSGQDTSDMYYKTITGLSHTLSEAKISPPDKEHESEANKAEDSLVDPSGEVESESSEDENDKDSGEISRPRLRIQGERG